MKTTLRTAVIALFFTAFCIGHAECAGKKDVLKVKVTGIRTFKGHVLVAAGDNTHPMKMTHAMVKANAETVECDLKGDVSPGTPIYVFHDANGNFKLDETEDGIPEEGCFVGVIERSETGTMTIRLEYPAERKNKE